MSRCNCWNNLEEMDISKEWNFRKQLQLAKFLAFLVCDEGKPRTPEDLCSACEIFTIRVVDVLKSCELPDGPIRRQADGYVGVTAAFSKCLNKSYFEVIFKQSPFGNGAAKDVLSPASGKEDSEVINQELKPELPAARTVFQSVDTMQEKGALPERPSHIQVSPSLGFPPGWKRPTANVVDPAPVKEDRKAINQGMKPELPAARADFEVVDSINEEQAVAEFPSLIRVEPSLGLPQRWQSPTENVMNPAPVKEECVETIKEEPAVTELLPCVQVNSKPGLHSRVKRLPAKGSKAHHQHDVNPSNFLDIPEKPVPATDAACLAIQSAAPFVNVITVQQKQKSRDTRGVPRFEDFAVEGVVGAGGYGTVYKVRRHEDEQFFAIKCPLENTHDSCVRNEINMLRRLRGKEFIIQFEREVTGKLNPKREDGRDEEISCPSIVLEFIEHDKPEVLKKEISIEELRSYCSSLFKALAQLHKEKILHLDVKPGNFLFSRSSKRGCLVDFNLARDESARRPSAKMPQRISGRRGDAEARTFERGNCRKRSLTHEDTTRTRVKPSKRSRKLVELSKIRRAEASHVKSTSAKRLCVGDENKRTKIPAAITDVRVASPMQSPQARPNSATGADTTSNKPADLLKDIKQNQNDAGNVQRLETARTPGHVVHGPRPVAGHPKIMTFLDKSVYNNHQSCASKPRSTQRKGVHALTGQSKRVGAAIPLEPGPVAQQINATGVKPALKVKGLYHRVKDGPCVGTKGYRAPEVLMRSTRQTTKVDMWSAGVSLLQLVTGRSPFPSTSTEGALKDIAKLRGSEAMENLAKSLGQRRRFTKDTCPGIAVEKWSERQSKRPDLKGTTPSSLYDLIEKCLEVDPVKRISAEDALLHQFCSPGTDASDVSLHPTLPMISP